MSFQSLYILSTIYYFISFIPQVTAFNGFSIPMPNEMTVIALVAWIFYELGNLRDATAIRIFRAIDDIVIQFGFYSSIILSCFSIGTSCDDVKPFLFIFMFFTTIFLIWLNWYFWRTRISSEKLWVYRTCIWLFIMSFAHAFVFRTQIKDGKDSFWSMLTFLFILISLFVCLKSANRNFRSIIFLFTALLCLSNNYDSLPISYYPQIGFLFP
ncbi:3190_t:CDS:1, partial [Gigaspora rosea]